MRVAWRVKQLNRRMKNATKCIGARWRWHCCALLIACHWKEHPEKRRSKSWRVPDKSRGVRVAFGERTAVFTASCAFVFKQYSRSAPEADPMLCTCSRVHCCRATKVCFCSFIYLFIYSPKKETRCKHMRKSCCEHMGRSYKFIKNHKWPQWHS